MCRILTKTSHLPGISLLLSYLISFHVTLLRFYLTKETMTVLSSQKSSLTVATILLLLLLLLAVSVPTVAVTYEEALTLEDCLALRHAPAAPPTDNNTSAIMADIICRDLIHIESRYGKSSWTYKNKKRRLDLQTSTVVSPPQAVAVVIDLPPRRPSRSLIATFIVNLRQYFFPPS